MSRQSQGYDATSDRALAAQGAVLAGQSNATAAQVRKLLNDVSSQTRQGLQADLDTAVDQTSDQSAQATLATRDIPSGSVATGFDTVFAERAESMVQFRAAVDAYLGMEPIPDTGAPPGTAALTDTAAPLSATQATNRISAAGNLVAGRPPVRLGAPVARRRCRSRPAAALGLGHRSAGVAARHGGRTGRPDGDIPHAGGHTRRGHSHHAARPPGPAVAAGRADQPLGAQPDPHPGRHGGPGEPGLGRRAARVGPLLHGGPVRTVPRQPMSRGPRSRWTPR